jgi:ankyrin repeat protein
VVQYLLEKGAAFDPPNSRNLTTLHLAAMHGRREVAAFLLDHGHSPNMDPHDWPTVLAAAVDCAQLEVVKLLLDKGANVNARVDFWGSALHQIGRDTTSFGPRAEKIDAERIKREVEIAQLLLDRGADLHARDSFGNTSLHEAAAHGQAELVALFLQRGAKVNARNSRNETPLLRAMEQRDDRRPGRDHQRAAETLRGHGGEE